MREIIFIALGGGAGAVSRYLVSKSVSGLSSGMFPYGTLAVNIIGSFLLGFLFSLFNTMIIPSQYKIMITVGFLGAFTTFSTYSLESLNFLMEGEYRIALTNVLINNIFSIAAVFFGIFLVRVLHHGIR
jgi:fluoride exporter